MPTRPRVWVSRPTFDDVIARLEPHFEVTAEPKETKFGPTELAAKLADCDAAIVGLKERVGTAALAGAKRRPTVADLGVGYGTLALAAQAAASVAASNKAYAPRR